MSEKDKDMDLMKHLHWWTLIIGILLGMFVMPTVLGFVQNKLG